MSHAMVSRVSEPRVALATLETDWECCSDPMPRIHPTNGRFFCHNCRAYLDAQSFDEGEGTTQTTHPTPIQKESE